MKYNDKESMRAERIFTFAVTAFIGLVVIGGSFLLWRLTLSLQAPEAPAEEPVREETLESLGSSSSVGAVHTEPGTDNLAVISPTIIRYTQPGASTPAWGYFFGYRNALQEPVYVSGFDVTIKDAAGKTIDEPLSTTFGPQILMPGATGYGVCAGLDAGTGSWPSEGLTIEVVPVSGTCAAPENMEEFTINGAGIAQTAPGSAEVQGRGVTVNAKCAGGGEASDVSAVVGLFRADGSLAGVACNMDDGVIPFGTAGDILCPFVVVAPGMDLAEAASLDPVLSVKNTAGTDQADSLDAESFTAR